MGDDEQRKSEKNKLPVRQTEPFRDLEKWLESDLPAPAGDARREIKAQAIRKLELLDEIYKDLVEKARGVLQKTEDDLRLHEIKMFARKIRGRTYFLYRRSQDAEEFFSILAPQDYRSADPSAIFLGEYHLNEDGTWTHRPA